MQLCVATRSVLGKIKRCSYIFECLKAKIILSYILRFSSYRAAKYAISITTIQTMYVKVILRRVRAVIVARLKQ